MPLCGPYLTVCRHSGLAYRYLICSENFRGIYQLIIFYCKWKHFPLFWKVLAGDVDPAIRTHAAFFSVWKRYGFTPEGFNLATLNVQVYFFFREMIILVYLLICPGVYGYKSHPFPFTWFWIEFFNTKTTSLCPNKCVRLIEFFDDITNFMILFIFKCLWSQLNIPVTTLISHDSRGRDMAQQKSKCFDEM